MKGIFFFVNKLLKNRPEIISLLSVFGANARFHFFFDLSRSRKHSFVEKKARKYSILFLIQQISNFIIDRIFIRLCEFFSFSFVLGYMFM
jgi:hypothetical protein